MRSTSLGLLYAGLFLAFANGINDNFKGVATLFGSGGAGCHSAVVFAALTTFAAALGALVYWLQGL